RHEACIHYASSAATSKRCDSTSRARIRVRNSPQDSERNRRRTEVINANYGCHVASVLLGLYQGGKPRAPMVELHQIEIAFHRAGGFHGVVAAACEQGGQLEVDGLRYLRLLCPRRVRSESRR